MDRKLLTVATAIVALLVAIVGIGIFNISAENSSNEKDVVYAASDVNSGKSTLNVAGEGKVTVKPDMALINMGVRTESKDAKAAQTQNAQKMEAVVKKLKALGISEDNIKTVEYSIIPQYDYSEGKSTFTGYQVNNIINVTVKDTSKLGDIIDQTAQAGANQMNNVSFTVNESDKYYNDAVSKAIAQAKVKANVMADAAGVKIKSIIDVSEAVNGPQPVYDLALAKEDAAATGATPVMSGQLEIIANVTVSFEIQ